MRMARLRLLFFGLALFLGSAFCVQQLYRQHSLSADLNIPNFSQLPPNMTKAMGLEFSSLLGDYIMLQVLAYMGEKVLLDLPTTEAEWHVIHNALSTVITLDPMATDPFVLAATTLPYESGMVKESNALLEIAAEHRPYDYKPNFFLWYNHHHFLKSPKAALVFLKESASKPNAPPYLKPLVSRMQLYAGEIEASMVYTMDVISTVKNDGMRQYMMRRLEALKRIDFLEKNIRKFKEKYGHSPQHLQELVVTGIIDEIPADPYGGEFYINDQGRVYSTSKLVQVQN